MSNRQEETIGIESKFTIGPWLVDPRKNVIATDSHRVRLEPKAMRVLVHLANRRGEDVPRDAILAEVWGGNHAQADVLSNAIWELRKALGDNPREPDFIQTVPGTGYRLVARVGADSIEPVAAHRRLAAYLFGCAMAFASGVLREASPAGPEETRYPL